MGYVLEKQGWILLVVAAAALAAAPAARAGQDVLVESIPANVDKAAALAAAKDALQNREWKIVAEDADSVSATISRSNVEARIRISIAGSRLTYQESALGRPKLDHTGRFVPSTTTTPSRWIEYLKTDTAERLMARSAAPVSAPAAKAQPGAPAAVGKTTGSNEPVAPRSSVQRMQELKEMLDRGLITGDEYARKKDEILKSL